VIKNTTIIAVSKNTLEPTKMEKLKEMRKEKRKDLSIWI